MSILHNIFSLINESLRLDYIFMFKVGKLPVLWKLWFVCKKYFYIIKCQLNFKKGESKTKIFGQDFYFPNKYGLTSLERIFTDNYQLAEYVKPGTKLLDVGAHVGEFNIFARQYLKSTEIYSIEPFTESYSLLCKNIPDHPENLFNFAIHHTEKVTMFLSKISSQLNSIYSSLLGHEASTPQNLDTETAPAIKLDDLISKNSLPFCDFLKIDVEGAEFDVIKTASQALKHVQYLYVEVQLQNRGNYELAELIGAIHQANPKLSLVDMNNYYEGRGAVDLIFVAKS